MRILGEKYSLQDEEDSRHGQVGRLWIPEAWYWLVYLIIYLFLYLQYLRVAR